MSSQSSRSSSASGSSTPGSGNDTDDTEVSCWGGAGSRRVSCHPIPNLPGAVRYGVPMDEKTLFELKSEADHLRIVDMMQKVGLSQPALSAFDKRQEEVTNTISVIEDSIDRGNQGIFDMKTTPLNLAEYVVDDDKAAIEEMQGDLRDFQERRRIENVKVLRAARQYAAESNKKTQEASNLITGNQEYQRRLQDCPLSYFATQNNLNVCKNEKSLFKIRREADLWKTVYGYKKDVLSSEALSQLNDRWEDLRNTALQIEASLGTEAEGSCIEMKTAPLIFSDYVQKEEVSQMHKLHTRFQRFRQGQVVRHLKQLKRPSRSSANSDEDPKAFDDLVSDHEAYVVRVQEFADTLTPEEFCQWPDEDAISKAKRQEMKVLVDTEKDLWARIDDYKSKQNRTISTPSD